MVAIHEALNFCHMIKLSSKLVILWNVIFISTQGVSYGDITTGHTTRANKNNIPLMARMITGNICGKKT